MTAFVDLSLDGEDWTLYWLLPGEWRELRVWEGVPPEAAARTVPAVVPGHAQSALFRSGQLPSPYIGKNADLWEWTADRDWVYEKRFRLPAAADSEVYLLRFEGIDDSAHVFLNGRLVGDHEGQFVPAEWDVTSHLRADEENHLVVVVRRDRHIGDREAHDPRWRSRFVESMEWGPPFTPVGIWDSVSLRGRGGTRFRSVRLYTNLSLDRTEATVAVICEFEAARATPVLVVTELTQAGLPVGTIEDPITIFRSDTSLVQSGSIPRAQLWWPNGHGGQPLYEARVSLVGEGDRLLDRRVLEFGVRDVEARACEGAPPDTLPYCLAVNGRPVWLKGLHWSPVDVLYGEVPAARYDRLLRAARAANVNLLRVGAGDLVEKDLFYRLCDRYGIMVWQELPLAPFCPENEPVADEGYLGHARRQAEAIVPRRANHPCLVIWSGPAQLAGADLEPFGSDHPALAELRSVVYEEDPGRLWLPTSPSGPVFYSDPARAGEMHDVHGPWRWLGLRDHPCYFNEIDPMLPSDFGIHGPAAEITLRGIFGDAPGLPEPRNEDWVRHGGGWWLRPPIEAAFGRPSGLPDFVRAGQILQALGLQYAIEASRRRKWRCAGVLPRGLGDSWSDGASLSVVDYFGRLKPAYYALKRAYRPFHVSAAFPTFSWAAEPALRADVWLHNSREGRALLNVVATIVDLQGRELYQESLAGEAPANGAEAVGDLSWRFPAGWSEAFLLLLEVIDEEGETIARSHYLHSRAADPAFAPYLSAPPAALRAERLDGSVLIQNDGPGLALAVTVDAGDSLVEDGDFPLAPGSSRLIRVTGPMEALTVAAWNCATVRC